MTPLERAMRYADNVPGAISGSGGHNQTFALACSLVNGFDLRTDEALCVLKIYNSKCQPPWTDAELLHKVNSASKVAHEKARGHLLNGEYKPDQSSTYVAPKPKVKIDPATAIEKYLNGFRCSMSDIADASPIKLSEDWTMDAVQLLQHAFRPGEMVNYVTQFQLYTKKDDGITKANPDGVGFTFSRDDLMDDWGTTGPPSTDAGGWMRINPMDGAGVKDSNVSSFRHTLIEFDRIPLDLQLSFIARLPLPITAILTSGGKSIHAWVRVDCPDIKSYKETVEHILHFVTPYGVDLQNKNPARLSRLVGVTRKIGAEGDGKQQLIYLSPNPEQRRIHD